MTTYKIVRKYQREDLADEVIYEDLTLEQAQAHCNDPETSWKTCKQKAGLSLTELYGPWFDAWYKVE